MGAQEWPVLLPEQLGLCLLGLHHSWDGRSCSQVFSPTLFSGLGEISHWEQAVLHPPASAEGFRRVSGRSSQQHP